MQDGRIASNYDNNTIRIWNKNSTGKDVFLQGHMNYVVALCQVRNGNVISGSFDRSIKIWDLKDNSCAYTIKTHSVNCILELDDKRICSCSDDKTIKIYDLVVIKCTETLSGHSNIVNQIALSTDKQYIVSCSDDMTIKLWG